MPNAFTPNNDGTNDVLRIVGPEQCRSPIMSLHNKWGQLIWEGDARVGWDGTVHGMPAPEGVYGYALRGRNDDLRFGWFVLAR
ncbi:MAG: gliding motility-associated C-terminal domain-containing protein [Flavobacteriales bacterium]|nr:gliding motility-associated C-terminal domain-containing protein [Flavobacteriales bacterium]